MKPLLFEKRGRPQRPTPLKPSDSYVVKKTDSKGEKKKKEVHELLSVLDFRREGKSLFLFLGSILCYYPRGPPF